VARLKKAAIHAGLDTLYYSGIYRLARAMVGGVGAILMFHHVRPPRDDPFQPNRHLEIAPQFLDEVIVALRAADVDIVSMDEAHRRLTSATPHRRFVVLTFDDGYRDNLTYAWPVLERHAVPFTLYVAAAFADGAGELWWRALEEAIAGQGSIAVAFDEATRLFDCATPQAKYETYGFLYRWLRQMPDEGALRAAVQRIAGDSGIDMPGQCRRECMDWGELSSLARELQVTIGAHTVNHVMLARVDADQARAEIRDSARLIEQRLGIAPRHFAYPVGDAAACGPREYATADAEYLTAVTTRPGVLFAEHRQHLTALPRISVNGEFQRLRYLDVLLSGAATGLWNGFRRVNAA
jgi:peptidoglycan/xylan/chitin deacetylase (PgdA/CDA1 family)